MAIWVFGDGRERSQPMTEKIAAVRERMTGYGDPDRLVRQTPPAEPHADLPVFSRRSTGTGDEVHGVVSF